MPIEAQLLKKWVGPDPEKHIESTPLLNPSQTLSANSELYREVNSQVTTQGRTNDHQSATTYWCMRTFHARAAVVVLWRSNNVNVIVIVHCADRTLGLITRLTRSPTVTAVLLVTVTPCLSVVSRCLCAACTALVKSPQLPVPVLVRRLEQLSSAATAGSFITSCRHFVHIKLIVVVVVWPDERVSRVVLEAL